MNKDIKKIHKRLEKDMLKNKPKLIRLCKEYVEKQDDSLIPDIQYLCERVFEDGQDLLLIAIATDEGVDNE